MNIVNFQSKYISQMIKIWNDACECGELLYKPFIEESFKQKYLDNPFDKYIFLMIDNDKVIGYIIGVINTNYLPKQTFENTPAYISMLIIDPKYRNKGYGKELLLKLENTYKELGKKSIKIAYTNPISLQWYIPNTNHDHNNAPGIDIDGLGYSFFEHQNYSTLSIELSLYLDLKEFQISDKVKEKINELNKQDIYVGFYNETMYGYDELFDHLNSELWRKDIKDNYTLENPLAVIVATHNNKIIGFTGPIDKEKSGRGWFKGIGVDPSYEKKGIAFVMFNLLMSEFKNIGADFSSIFTSSDNHAYKIYSRIGFKVVRQWAIMEKNI